MATKVYRVRLFWERDLRLEDDEGMTVFLDLDTPAGLQEAEGKLNRLVVHLAHRDRARDKDIPGYTLGVYQADGVTWVLDWPAPPVRNHR
jgi:hypothetical protein